MVTKHKEPLLDKIAASFAQPKRAPKAVTPLEQIRQLQVIKLDLSDASRQVLNVVGDFIHCDQASTGLINIGPNVKSSSEPLMLSAYPGATVEGIAFDSLAVEWSAQTGKKATLIVGNQCKVRTANSTLPDSVGNPFEVNLLSGNLLAPSGTSPWLDLVGFPNLNVIKRIVVESICASLSNASGCMAFLDINTRRYVDGVGIVPTRLHTLMAGPQRQANIITAGINLTVDKASIAVIQPAFYIRMYLDAFGAGGTVYGAVKLAGRYYDI